MGEPFYIRQIDEKDLPSGAEWSRAWLKDAAREAKSKGAGWLRATTCEVIILLEGWKEKPDDEGAPRFMLSARDGETG